jgi:hypothetical protein
VIASSAGAVDVDVPSSDELVVLLVSGDVVLVVDEVDVSTPADVLVALLSVDELHAATAPAHRPTTSKERNTRGRGMA